MSGDNPNFVSKRKKHCRDVAVRRLCQNIDKEDRELIMRLSPLYTQKLEEAERRGEKKGQIEVVETLLKSRFGSLDNQLSTVIEPLLSLPTEEFTPLLLKLSREELLERFGKQ